MHTLNNISVILPSLDPDEKLITVIDGLLEQGFCDIILINDGSKPENLHYFQEAARHSQVTLLHHSVNRGKGAALKTGIDWFLEHRTDFLGVVTVDGDNQHAPEDITACSLKMQETGKTILGCRDFSLPHVPPRSKAGNRITSWVFKAFVGMTLSDTQTGLRAFPIQVLPQLTKVAGDRFEYETNVLLEMKKFNLPFEEVSIRTVYIEENKSSHFRAVRDSWRIYKLILAHFFRYTASSLITSVLEEGMYVVFNLLLNPHLSGFALTAATTGIARFLSSLVNFYLNQRMVFHAKGNTGKALLKYFALAIPLVFFQMLLTFGIYALFSISEAQTVLRAVIYAGVMVALFFVSFFVQQRWVFVSKKE